MISHFENPSETKCERLIQQWSKLDFELCQHSDEIQFIISDLIWFDLTSDLSVRTRLNVRTTKPSLTICSRMRARCIRSPGHGAEVTRPPTCGLWWSLRAIHHSAMCVTISILDWIILISTRDCNDLSFGKNSVGFLDRRETFPCKFRINTATLNGWNRLGHYLSWLARLSASSSNYLSDLVIPTPVGQYLDDRTA
jgi:hypothetical protein